MFRDKLRRFTPSYPREVATGIEARRELFEELALLHGERPSVITGALSRLPEGQRDLLLDAGVVSRPLDAGVLWQVTRLGLRVIAECSRLSIERDEEFRRSVPGVPPVGAVHDEPSVDPSALATGVPGAGARASLPISSGAGTATALVRACANFEAGRLSEALDLLDGFVPADQESADRASLLRARVLHEQGNGDEARRILGGLGDQLSLEIRLDLADTLSRLGHLDRSSCLCEELLRDLRRAPETERAGASMRRLAALAHYRLARNALSADNRDGAFHHWRVAFEANDPTASAYAARCLASKIGSPRLVPERIEELYRYAIYSRFAALSARASLELADHLAVRHQYRSAAEFVDRAALHPRTAAAAARRRELLGFERRAASTLRVFDGLPELRKIADELRGRRLEGLERVVIVGAGTGGQYLLRDVLSRSPTDHVVLGFVDDEAHEVPGYPYRILGTLRQLPEVLALHKPDAVWMAIPTAAGSVRSRVVHFCRDAGVELKNLPRMNELYLRWTPETGESLFAQLRAVQYHETVGHSPVSVDWPAIGSVRGERAMVVGTGVLGSELARCLVHGGVERIVLVDRDQAAVGRLSAELKTRVGKSEFDVVFDEHAQSTDSDRLAELVEEHSPTLIFHATGAGSPRIGAQDSREFVKHEIESTSAVLHAAVAKGAENCRLVHVSSVYARDTETYFGTIRALSEAIVLSDTTDVRSTVVRVPPLLESQSSLIGVIQAEVSETGPVALPSGVASDRFISAARAAELVLQAARLGRPGSLLEAAAGDEVNLEAAAEEMIRLAGRRPLEDIAIEHSTLEYVQTPRLNAERPVDPDVPDLVVGEPQWRDQWFVKAAATELLGLVRSGSREQLDTYVRALGQSTDSSVLVI